MTKSMKPLLSVLRGETVQPAPIWLMRQAGRYLPEYKKLRSQAPGFLEFCLHPEMAAEATLQPIRRYGFDAAILFADILLVPHALGQRLRYVDDVGPQLDALKGDADVGRLKVGAVREGLSPVYETIRRVRKELPKNCALIGFAGAPWTVASYMVEGGTSRNHELAKRWAYGNPEGFGKLIDMLVEATAGYLEEQIAAGAEALQIFDSWAGSLSAEQFDRWCKAPIKALVKRVKAAHPQIPIIVFPRGAGTRYEGFAKAVGGNAVGLDESVDPRWAAKHLQRDSAVQGNVDPQLMVVGGKPLKAAAEGVLDALGRGPLIFNLGHGVVPEVPPEHVAELISTVRGWRP